MKKETRMRRVMRAVDQMKNRGKISAEERKITSDLATDDRDRDIGNLATFIHNTKQGENES